jgi:hypothetical protein
MLLAGGGAAAVSGLLAPPPLYLMQAAAAAAAALPMALAGAKAVLGVWHLAGIMHNLHNVTVCASACMCVDDLPASMLCGLMLQVTACTLNGTMAGYM